MSQFGRTWRRATYSAALCVMGLLAGPPSHLQGALRLVSNSAEFRTALRDAAPGDVLRLASGTYEGGLYRAGLRDVVIEGADPQHPPVIVGGNQALQLSDAVQVTLQHLVLMDQTDNGLNIDDGGSWDTPSRQITIRHVTVRGTGPSGNRDGIKLSGVDGFLIDQVRVENWGDGGSAIDPVGSHHGIIQNSWFRHDRLSPVGSGVRPKGGSHAIIIRGNRFEMYNSQGLGTGRAIQAGGSTGAEFFRFEAPDSGFEAAQIVAEGNIVLGSSAPFAYVNIDGGDFRYNLAVDPQDWVVRILNENPGTSIVDTQNGRFHHNTIIYQDTADLFRTAVNVGSETFPNTFEFTENHWFNRTNPLLSQPLLPVAEQGGIYGVPPQLSPTSANRFEFDWGSWLVNATPESQTLVLPLNQSAWLATPRESSRWQLESANPFLGEWQFAPRQTETVTLPPFSQAYYAHRPLAGCDLQGDQAVDAFDLGAMFASWGRATLYDLTGDGVTDAQDAGFCFAEWTGDSVGTSVPEPLGGGWGAFALVLTQAWWRRKRPSSPIVGRIIEC